MNLACRLWARFSFARNASQVSPQLRLSSSRWRIFQINRGPPVPTATRGTRLRRHHHPDGGHRAQRAGRTGRVGCRHHLRADVRQRRFDYLPPVVRPLRRPVPQGRPEAGPYGRDAERANQRRELVVADRVAAPTRKPSPAPAPPAEPLSRFASCSATALQLSVEGIQQPVHPGPTGRHLVEGLLERRREADVGHLRKVPAQPGAYEPPERRHHEHAAVEQHAGPVDQRLQRIRNQQVSGSSPLAGSRFSALVRETYGAPPRAADGTPARVGCT